MSRNKEPLALLEAKGKSHLTKAEKKARAESEIKVPFTDVHAPDYLPPKLKKEFDKIAEKLLAIGIMTELDEDCLARYVLSQENYLNYTQMLLQAAQNGDIVKIERLQTLQDKAFRQARMCGQDLGLTITSRCRLVVPETNDTEDEEDYYS